MQADRILKLVRLSEKSNKLSSELGQYTFEVYGHANKHQIAEAVEQTFKVTVRRVNTQNYRGKNKKSRQGRPVERDRHGRRKRARSPRDHDERRRKERGATPERGVRTQGISDRAA